MRQRWIILLFSLKISAGIALVDDDSLTYEAIEQRLAPRDHYNATSTSPPTPTTHTPRSGKVVYETVCSLCHQDGIMGAPNVGNYHAWFSRAKQGLNKLMVHAIQGYHFMPMRGTCLDCSDKEIQNAILYMLSRSGVKITIK